MMITSKIKKYEDYKMYEYFEDGQAVGTVVVMWCGYDYFQVAHVDLKKQLFQTIITMLVEEYTSKGKYLLCEEVDKEEVPIYGGFGFLDRNRCD